MTIGRDQAGTKAADGEYAIRIAASIDAFTREEWDDFAGASRDCAGTAYNPFVSYDFLSILEESAAPLGVQAGRGIIFAWRLRTARFLAPCPAM